MPDTEITKTMSLITPEHKEYINKQITKALKSIDWEGYVTDYIENLFEQSSTDDVAIDNFNLLMFKVMADLFVKKGLLKNAEVSAVTENDEDEESQDE